MSSVRWTMTAQQQEAAVREAAAAFPPVFGLKAFPGKNFRIGLGISYMGPSGTIYLYTMLETAPGKWECFCKGLVEELRAELVVLSAAELEAREVLGCN